MSEMRFIASERGLRYNRPAGKYNSRDNTRRANPMIRCNNCGTHNIDGSEYCDECGMKLDAGYEPKFLKPEPAPPAYQPPSALQQQNSRSSGSTGRYDSIPPEARMPAAIQEPSTQESS